MRSLSLLLISCSLACGQRPVDVVFITVDTLRYDHVSALDPDSPADTPFMDLLVQEGVTYTQAYSPISVTGPAFCTLMTGQRPGTHGVVMNVFRGGNVLSTETPTLAKRLKQAGYHTGAFVSGFTLRRNLGLAQGFQKYSTPVEARRAGGETAEAFWSWLQTRPGPVFSWYHSYDAHGPLEPYNDPPITKDLRRGGPDLERIPEYQRIGDISDVAFFSARYATAVEYADASVGRVFDVLHNTGRWDDALIILTADHGETLDERELWFDHGTTPHEEQLHVPLVIRYPRGEGGGRTVDALVGLEDLMPTVLEYLGEELPEGMDGRSLLSEGAAGHDVLLGESSHCKGEKVLSCAPRGPGGKMYAVRTAERTTVRRASKDGVSYERYDRVVDRPELHPLARPEMDAAAPSSEEAVVVDLPMPRAWDATDGTALQTLDDMASLRDGMGLRGPEKKASTDAESDAERQEREALQALGYMDQ